MTVDAMSRLTGSGINITSLCKSQECAGDERMERRSVFMTNYYRANFPIGPKAPKPGEPPGQFPPVTAPVRLISRPPTRSKRPDTRTFRFAD